jgi:hypothetical protein
MRKKKIAAIALKLARHLDVPAYVLAFSPLYGVAMIDPKDLLNIAVLIAVYAKV